MSTHSYSRCWLHLIWETLRREPMLDKGRPRKPPQIYRSIHLRKAST